MNQSNSNNAALGKRIIFTSLAVVASFLFTFVSLSYLLFSMTNYENYYGIFTFVLLFCESFIIVLITRRLAKDFPAITFISSALISVISLALGITLSHSLQAFPRMLATHLIFILTTVLLQIILKKKQPKSMS